jgi:hypothetical protein
MRETRYQRELINRLKQQFPGLVVLKNDPQHFQGIPDLTLLFEDRWAELEVKASEDAPEQPNQGYYIGMMNHMSFAAFVYPENEEEVVHGLQRAFYSGRSTRVSWGEQLPLDKL